MNTETGTAQAEDLEIYIFKCTLNCSYDKALRDYL